MFETQNLPKGYLIDLKHKKYNKNEECWNDLM